MMGFQGEGGGRGGKGGGEGGGGRGGGGKGGGGVWFQTYEGRCKKMTLFSHLPFFLCNYTPLKSHRSFKAARPIEAMIGVSKAS